MFLCEKKKVVMFFFLISLFYIWNIINKILLYIYLDLIKKLWISNKKRKKNTKKKYCLMNCQKKKKKKKKKGLITLMFWYNILIYLFI